MNTTPSARRRSLATRTDGFTLIEIMVVILILGLLATIVAPNFFAIGEDAKLRKAEMDCKEILNQAQYWRLQNNKVPGIDDLTKPDSKNRVLLPNYTQDPWDHDYIIRDSEGQLEVISMGPDGIESTDDDLTSKPKTKN